MIARKKRKIAVFTGNRAEYGLQFPILKAIAADSRLEYFLLVGGAHLERDFGSTLAEIRSDGFNIYREVGIEMKHDSLFATSQAIGTGILSVSRILEQLRPDFLVAYADRFESFAAVTAATQMNIPTAHIEGGDYTDGGALDDSIRHAMTKLSHLHFATNDQAASRLIGLGEERWRVFTVGMPALDLVSDGAFPTCDEIAEELEIDLNRPVILFCQHSVTTEFDNAEKQILPSLKAIEELAREGFQVIATYPNNDAGGRCILRHLQAFNRQMIPDFRLVASLGRYRFHGLLNLIGRNGCGAFLGNSSAGIKETPVFGCPVVNIGTRQRGRLRGENVVDVPYSTSRIVEAVRRCSHDGEFRAICRRGMNPYGAGNAGRQISETLATIPIDSRLLQKKMTY